MRRFSSFCSERSGLRKLHIRTGRRLRYYFPGKIRNFKGTSVISASVFKFFRLLQLHRLAGSLQSSKAHSLSEDKRKQKIKNPSFDSNSPNVVRYQLLCFACNSAVSAI
ncbi:hypothetical protein FF1_009875 [Malus domestica]